VYTFTPNAGECADDATLTITVNNKVLPTFNAVAAICEDDALTALPTTSNNGISGTWSPALNNTATTIYTFTPGTSECAESASLTITVNNKVVPTFNAVLPICEGGINPLPATSLEGITGTWSPVFDNTVINDTNYTFIPDVNQCIDNTTPNVITVTVNPIITPTFSPVGPICEGDAISLPTVSLEGVLGTWSPAIDDTITTEYTFTPNSDQCAPETTLTIIVYEIPEATIVNGCNNANYTLSTFEPNGDYSYNWYDSAGNLVSEEVSFVITTPDTYELQVSNGTCMVSESINITNIFCAIPKGISPNGDGLNDTWDLSNFDIKQVKIFDRYGVEIYSKNNYSNQWDGTSKGNELPSATYYYVITFNNNTTKTGWVYINR
jgi:gliding motility-associated-like protein